MLGTSKRAVEIFAHEESQKCYLYWRGTLRNATGENDNTEQWVHHKGLERAIVMGHRFERIVDNSKRCAWHTSNEKAFHL